MKPAILLISSLVLCVSSQNAMAAWPQHGAPVCTADLVQTLPILVPDQDGGAIVAWLDTRDSNYYNLYAQRIDGAGNTLWTTDGVVVSPTSTNGIPSMISDGSGGAIITWAGGGSVYGQRFDAAGNALWGSNGVVLASPGHSPALVPDGAGGVIVAWDRDAGIYAQRFDGAGSAQWPAPGVELSAGADLKMPEIVSDGAAGAVVMWIDHDSDTRFMDLYAGRVDASGNVPWTEVLLCDDANAGPYTETHPVMVSDGAGGAIVAWDDYRAPIDIYAQRVNASGNVWVPNGVALCTDPMGQEKPGIVPDGAGGAIVTWQDYRNDAEIFARRIDATGNALWAQDGVPVVTAAGLQLAQVTISDGAGGAIVAFNDNRVGSSFDIYAGRIDGSGNAVWSTAGVPLSTDGNNQFPSIAPDGVGGAIVAWTDYGANYSDVFAQRVVASGSVPTGVTDPARVPSLSASEVYPNPFAGVASMDLGLSSSSPVRVEVFDVAGRLVRTLVVPGVVGLQRVELNGRDKTGRLLPSGVYFCRVQVAGESLTRKMVIAR